MAAEKPDPWLPEAVLAGAGCLLGQPKSVSAWLYAALMDSAWNLEPPQFYFQTTGCHRRAEKSEVLVSLRGLTQTPQKKKGGGVCT